MAPLARSCSLLRLEGYGYALQGEGSRCHHRLRHAASSLRHLLASYVGSDYDP